MRIMHLRTVVGSGGGPEKTILSSPRFLPEDDVVLVYVRPRDDPDFDLVERAEAAGATLIDIPESSGFDPRTVIRLRKEIAAFRPDIVHAHDYKTNLLGLLCRPKQSKLLTTVHGYVSRGGKLEVYYYLDRFALRRMDYVIAVSEDLEHHVVEMGVDRERVCTIDNAIDEDLFQRRRTSREARVELGLHPDRLLIGGVGRLATEKGFDLLIDATEQLIKAGMDLELVIIGEGDQRQALEAQIASTDYSDRMHLLGYRSDTLQLYEAMDLFVLSSLREGLPNVVLEAMAMDVPVVATNIAGVPKLIRDQHNGLLIREGEVEPLRVAMAELIENSGKREALARQARETIVESFSFSARMAKMREIYLNVSR